MSYLKNTSQSRWSRSMGSGSQPAMAHAEDQALEAVAWAGSRLDHFTMKGASRPAPSWSAKHMCSRLNFYGRVEVGPRGTNAK
jgi:hypothetical protein